MTLDNDYKYVVSIYGCITSCNLIKILFLYVNSREIVYAKNPILQCIYHKLWKTSIFNNFLINKRPQFFKMCPNIIWAFVKTLWQTATAESVTQYRKGAENEFSLDIGWYILCQTNLDWSGCKQTTWPPKNRACFLRCEDSSSGSFATSLICSKYLAFKCDYYYTLVYLFFIRITLWRKQEKVCTVLLALIQAA